MEATSKKQQETYVDYVEYLNDAIEVLIGVETSNHWDEAILRAIRNLTEIKYYLKSCME